MTTTDKDRHPFALPLDEIPEDLTVGVDWAADGKQSVVVVGMNSGHGADRTLRRVIELQNTIDRTEVMGTPQGLRNLFPTNLSRLRVRDVSMADLYKMMTPIQQRVLLQRKAKSMKQPPKQDEVRRDTPTANAEQAQQAEQASAGNGTRDQLPSILPASTHAPGPAELAGNREAQTIAAGDVGEVQGVVGERPDGAAPGVQVGGTGGAHKPVVVTDPGPPPPRPDYIGDGRYVPPVVDQLLMAAETRDRDALRAVPTRNEPPAVAQYKANLLQWLDDLDAHKASTVLPDAEQGIDPDQGGGPA